LYLTTIRPRGRKGVNKLITDTATNCPRKHFCAFICFIALYSDGWSDNINILPRC